LAIFFGSIDDDGKHVSYNVKEHGREGIPLPKPFEHLKIVADLIIHFDSHATPLGEFGYPIAPLDGKTFHS
jgi:hypothetical protein